MATLCACGCGGFTKWAGGSFIRGHNQRVRGNHTFRAAKCEHCGTDFQAQTVNAGRFCSPGCWSAWQLATNAGKRTQNADGYIFIRQADGSDRAEHVLIVEAALGRRLRKGEQVHHYNENPPDNRNANLVICQNAGYHQFLHWLQNVRAAGGRPFLDRICCVCKSVKPATEFYRTATQCKTCTRVRDREWRDRGRVAC